MKKISLVLLICGVMWGCGQNDDSGPELSQEELKLKTIKKDVDPNQELKKQQTRQVFESLCTYSESTHSQIKDLSRQMNSSGYSVIGYSSSQPVNALHSDDDEINKSIYLKLSIIKHLNKSAAKQRLTVNFEELSERSSLDISADEMMYLSYLATASTTSNSYISTLNELLAVYTEVGSTLPPIAYLGKLAYFFTEAEQMYKIDKLVMAKKYVEKFKSASGYSESSIYSHILAFLNDPSSNKTVNSEDFIVSSSGELNKYLKLSMALNSSVEEVKACVDQYKRSSWQAAIPYSYYNSDSNTLNALEVLTIEALIQKQQNALGYKVFLL